MADPEYKDNYHEALERAGAVVHQFLSSGDYQGTWVALVTYEGKTYWISDYYGSCSGCDAFQAEFDFDGGPICPEHRYTFKKDAIAACESCKEHKASYEERIVAFGRGYLTEKPMTQEEMEAHLSKDIEWDLERTPLLDFVKQHKITDVQPIN